MFVRIGAEQYVNLSLATNIILQGNAGGGGFITAWFNAPPPNSAVQGSLDAEEYKKAKEFLESGLRT